MKTIKLDHWELFSDGLCADEEFIYSLSNKYKLHIKKAPDYDALRWALFLEDCIHNKQKQLHIIYDNAAIISEENSLANVFLRANDFIESEECVLKEIMDGKITNV